MFWNLVPQGLNLNGTHGLLSRQKTYKFSTFLKNIQFYISVSVDKDAMNNSGRYFTCGVCNLENVVTKLQKATLGHEIWYSILTFSVETASHEFRLNMAFVLNCNRLTGHIANQNWKAFIDSCLRLFLTFKKNCYAFLKTFPNKLLRYSRLDLWVTPLPLYHCLLN